MSCEYSKKRKKWTHKEEKMYVKSKRLIEKHDDEEN